MMDWFARTADMGWGIAIGLTVGFLVGTLIGSTVLAWVKSKLGDK